MKKRSKNGRRRSRLVLFAPPKVVYGKRRIFRTHSKVKDMYLDCDQDTLLLFVEPIGPTCHTGAQSCFGTEDGFKVQQLEETVATRAQEADSGSYTQYLLNEGKEKITKKFGEEAFEVAIAAMKDDRDELIAESADVLYHLFVLLQAQDVTFAEVEALLGNGMRSVIILKVNVKILKNGRLRTLS